MNEQIRSRTDHAAPDELNIPSHRRQEPRSMIIPSNRIIRAVFSIRPNRLIRVQAAAGLLDRSLGLLTIQVASPISGHTRSTDSAIHSISGGET